MYDANGSWREPNNHDRAGFAHRALDEYARITRSDPGEGDIEEKAGDLIGDLMHLMALTGWNPYEVIGRGIGHFVAELTGDMAGNHDRLANEAPDLLAAAEGRHKMNKEQYERINTLLYGK